MSEFTGEGFYTETLKMYRGFDLSHEGKLEAVSISEYSWPSGEALAECSGKKLTDFSNVHEHLENCKCGYYSYFGDSSDFHFAQRGNIDGIIEAYGDIVLGSKGIRSSKAKIVALSSPGIRPPDDPEPGYKALLYRTFGNKVGPQLKYHLPVISGFLGMAGVLVIFARLPFLALALFLLSGIVSILSMLSSRTFEGYEGYKAEKSLKIQRNYPGVALFNSKEEMFEVYPPSKRSDIELPDKEDEPEPYNYKSAKTELIRELREQAIQSWMYSWGEPRNLRGDETNG